MISRSHIDRRVKYALRRKLRAEGFKGAASLINADNPKFGGATIAGINKLRERNGWPETGLLTPPVMVLIGPYISGGLGERAAIAECFFEGDLETVGENLGPILNQIKGIGTDLNPQAAWPYCAAGWSFGMKCAGWKHHAEFVKTLGDSWVPGLWQLAGQGKFGFERVGWDEQKRSAMPMNYAMLFQFDSDPELDHVGRPTARNANSMCWTIEYNTGSGAAGNQADGEGAFQRHRPIRNATLVRHPG